MPRVAPPRTRSWRAKVARPHGHGIPQQRRSHPQQGRQPWTRPTATAPATTPPVIPSAGPAAGGTGVEGPPGRSRHDAAATTGVLRGDPSTPALRASAQDDRPFGRSSDTLRPCGPPLRMTARLGNPRTHSGPPGLRSLRMTGRVRRRRRPASWLQCRYAEGGTAGRARSRPNPRRDEATGGGGAGAELLRAPNPARGHPVPRAVTPMEVAQPAPPGRARGARRSRASTAMGFRSSAVVTASKTGSRGPDQRPRPPPQPHPSSRAQVPPQAGPESKDPLAEAGTTLQPRRGSCGEILRLRPSGPPLRMTDRLGGPRTHSGPAGLRSG